MMLPHLYSQWWWNQITVSHLCWGCKVGEWKATLESYHTTAKFNNYIFYFSFHRFELTLALLWHLKCKWSPQRHCLWSPVQWDRISSLMRALRGVRKSTEAQTAVWCGLKMSLFPFCSLWRKNLLLSWARLRSKSVSVDMHRHTSIIAN